MSFEELGLRAELLRAISARGYTTPTPIQEKAIPVILDGRDVRRIVVECVDDMEPFQEVADLPVVHLAEVTP